MPATELGGGFLTQKNFSQSRMRTRFAKWVLGACWCLSWFALPPTTFANQQDALRPNIIFILADDMGFGDLGCYGQQTLTTPNIDRMAAEGMRFTRHYAGSTVCAPSRCVLMTGLHTGHCSVRGNQGPGMPDEEVTVAEVLKSAGYATGCFGKWGIGNPPPRDDPNRQGFDEFYGYVNMFHAHNFYPPFLIRNGEVEKLRNVTKPMWLQRPGNEMGGLKEGAGVAMPDAKFDYAPDLIADEALKFIDAKTAADEAPFFLYFALNVPHANNEGGNDPDQKNGMEVPDYGEFSDRDWPEPEKGFAAMIRNIDRDVGRILDRLVTHGIDEKTLVIFSSDNGPHAEGRHQMEYFDSNGKLRGMKRDLFDGGVRVPMIARWPGKVAAGAESDHLSGFQDFVPTMAELAGPQAQGEVERTDGLSLLPTLLGNAKAQEKHEYLYWEFEEKGGRRGVTTEKWKALRLDVNKNPQAPVQLYDLKNDPSETKDVAAENPQVVERMTAWMAAEHE